MPRARSLWDIRMSRRRFLLIMLGIVALGALPKRALAAQPRLRVRALTKAALYRTHGWAG